MRGSIRQLFVVFFLASCTANQEPLTTINARADGKLLVLPVTIDGSPQWFSWDTGAPSLIIDPRLAQSLALKGHAPRSVTGTGAGSIAILHAPPLRVRLGSESYVASDPWIIDLSEVPIAKNVRGLVGADLWSRYAVQMNSQRKTLGLFRAGSYRPGRDEIALPLIVANNKMYIDVVLDVKPGLTTTERLRVDTGSEDSVNDPVIGQSLEVRRTTLGNGLGENFKSVSGKLQAVHIGPFTIKNVWGPGGKGPSIGMELLRRFLVTFDARAAKIYLKPTPDLSEAVPPPPQ